MGFYLPIYHSAVDDFGFISDLFVILGSKFQKHFTGMKFWIDNLSTFKF